MLWVSPISKFQTAADILFFCTVQYVIVLDSLASLMRLPVPHNIYLAVFSFPFEAAWSVFERKCILLVSHWIISVRLSCICYRVMTAHFVFPLKMQNVASVSVYIWACNWACSIIFQGTPIDLMWQTCKICGSQRQLLHSNLIISIFLLLVLLLVLLGCWYCYPSWTVSPFLLSSVSVTRKIFYCS